MDNWEGQPGAAVVAQGASVTRERRLLDWANEMEALVTTQVSPICRHHTVMQMSNMKELQLFLSCGDLTAGMRCS